MKNVETVMKVKPRKTVSRRRRPPAKVEIVDLTKRNRKILGTVDLVMKKAESESWESVKSSLSD